MTASRRQFLGAAAAVAATRTSAARAATLPGEGGRPNILWIVSEDNCPYLGAYGDPVARTPSIDAMAREGILYRHAYANAPVCAPSRFAMLTGVAPESCAPANHMRANAKASGILPTWPELMRQAGYYCTNNAKTDWNCDVDPAIVFDASGPQAHWRDRPAGRPFAAMVTLMISHESQIFEAVEGGVKPGDVRVPAYLPDTRRTRQDIASYYNRLEQMDWQVGTLLAELEAAGLADETIIIHSSDNGGVFGRSKRHCYEEGLRCTLIVRLPAKWRHLAPVGPGSVIDDPVMLYDIAPTLLSLGGAPIPSTMQAQPLLGPAAAPARAYAFGMRNRMDERIDCVRTVCDGEYRYIRNYMPYLPSGQYQAFAWLAGGYQEWDALNRAGALNAAQARFFAPRPFEELYNLALDPDQVDNLAGRMEQRDRIAAMRAVLDQHMLAINDNGFIPEGSSIEGFVASRIDGVYPLADVMKLAGLAAQRDPAHRSTLEAALGQANEVLRYWGALGIAMLDDCGEAAEKLREMMDRDPSCQVRIVAAEALLRGGVPEGAVEALTKLLVPAVDKRVQLAAVNVLTRAGEEARPALPRLRQLAALDDEYLPNAATYCIQNLEGSFDPNRPIFSLEKLQQAASKKGTKQ